MTKQLRNLLFIIFIFVAYTLNAQPHLKGSWEIIPELTDEFEGGELNSTKWFNYDPEWEGRHPSYFERNNVSVKDGKLHLKVRKINSQDIPPSENTDRPISKASIKSVAKYGSYTHAAAAVKSKVKVKYGYFEIKCKPSNARVWNSFWFVNWDKKPRNWTEIDVFEIVKSENYLVRTAHLFESPTYKGSEDDHLRRAYEDLSYTLTGYHVYGLDWNEDKITWFVDDVEVFSINNNHWHQELYMEFDTELSNVWPKTPDPTTLPASFDIEYIKSWKRKNKKSWKRKNKLVSAEGPSIAKQGQSITINVKYEVKEARKIFTGLHFGHKSDWYAGASKEVAAGSGTVALTYTIPSNLAVGNDYVYYSYVTKVGGKWEKGLPSKSQRLVTIEQKKGYR